MPLILGTNSIKDTGYEVANSCRFNDGDSAYMHKALGTPTSTKIGTLSTWFKRSQLDQEMNLLGAETDSNDRGYIQLDDGTNGIIRCWAEASSSAVFDLRTNRLFRDVSAWYHIVVAYDTSQSTASNRVKIYINGTQETSFSTETYPSQDVTTMPWNISGYNTSVGAQKGGSGSYGTFFDGYQAETVFIDGQQLAPTSFGEFDEDSPRIWKPIDVSGLTFGNNGFYLDYEDSANLGNDANGGTDFTEVNLAATDQATDTPTNNFATFNTLLKSGATFSEGNTRYQAPSSNPVFGSVSTIGTTKGKWYAEVDYNAGSNHYLILGVADDNFISNGDVGVETNWDLGKTGQATASIAYVVNTGAYRVNNSNTNWGSAGGDGNIIMIAVDQDNEKIYFGVDGTWGNSSDPAAGSNGIDVSSVLTGSTWYIGVTNDTGASETIADFNFGNPSFAISSGNSDGAGYGNFEFSVPSGFYSLCTKNLAEYG